MHTSHFQLGLIATLAAGLGFSIASSSAIGYPGGAVVSEGANPVRSYGGTVYTGSPISLDTMPSDQDFIVTDISLTAKSTDADCLDRIDVQVVTLGTTVASYSLATAYSRGSYAALTSAETVHRALESGLRIPAGGELELHASSFSSFTYGGCDSGRGPRVEYTLAGYYAQP